ncbi:hypothetical protein [Rugamonas aquatica]|uniref:GIY-YIG nuclease family protein n=1 Tax=Rugamonas aquatica TaxID=2743357 RepID=A0A6A7N774_9BURK|nr:hypothetical protein [Rugamonas aquatica]MQA40647.1 hypothetical protein [Rugamonas aquatica]
MLPQLISQGLKKEALGRSIYVIRLAGNFAISYPGGISPAVYVGQGSFNQRIEKHKKWAVELMELVGDYHFEVCVATPRVKGQPNTYLDAEAVLLHRFRDRYGSAPLWNKKLERRRFPHHHYNQRKVDYVLYNRSGSRYQWALKPMKSSPFYDSYLKTHS